MRIEVLFLRVMLLWYYGSELAVAETSRPEGHHANPVEPPACVTLLEGYNIGPLWKEVQLDLYTKCLDPANDMNVIRAHNILSLAETPDEESNEAPGQVTGDHVRGQMNLVKTQSSLSLVPTPAEESDSSRGVGRSICSGPHRS
jgi:hypothetical protein